MFQKRSQEPEIIDTGKYTPEEYEGFLREIRLINRFAGDIWALRKTLLQEIGKENPASFSVLDVGAGSGELLRKCAEFAEKKNISAHFFGLELNARSAQTILEESERFPNILSLQGNALSLPFADNSFDYVICSLFTHHFVDQKVVEILSEMSRVSRKKTFVIDLHRHQIAYFLFKNFAKLFLSNRLVLHDGALSVLRGFKPNELKNLAFRAKLKNVSVKRHFPFRLVLESEK